ncbi:ion transporter [Pedobacter sp. SYSU D00535]|uniref:potassium channel family protein n=1 Tax=Pedobacter sp. SYSU D00535 TaxID=2810308 RepID=UPI001A95E84D|nr:ion transporter [Pedobacter sp. SYSU D00535]
MKQKEELNKQRYQLLKSVEKFMEGPMSFLGFIWLVLLVLELTHGLNDALQLVSSVIWLAFLLDFLVKVILAPLKLNYLKRNVLTIVSLIIPGLRFFRVFPFIRYIRFLRSARLIKIVASLNRGMKSLNATMNRRGFSYIMLLNLIVIFAGAAGMYAFENQEGGLDNYVRALWWTVMLVITVGTDFWPQTTEGRVLCFILALYGFAVFGYITATLASFFVGRDAEEQQASIAGAAEINSLRQEVQELSKLVRELKNNGQT